MNKIIWIFIFLLSANGYSSNASPFWTSHTFVMIYSSKCPHCHRQVKVLAPLFKKFNIPHMLYSVDGGALDEFQSFENAPDALLKAAFPDERVVFPATFIVDNQTLRLYPVAKGFLDTQELKDRVGLLAPKIIQFEGGRQDA